MTSHTLFIKKYIVSKPQPQPNPNTQSSVVQQRTFPLSLPRPPRLQYDDIKTT